MVVNGFLFVLGTEMMIHVVFIISHLGYSKTQWICLLAIFHKTNKGIFEKCN